MELGDLKGTDALWGGVLALPYVAYKVWQSIKSDQKGDSLDGRIQSFNQQLQAQLDKAMLRVDSLSLEKSKLEAENSDLKATIRIITAENQRINTSSKQSLPGGSETTT